MPSRLLRGALAAAALLCGAAPAVAANAIFEPLFMVTKVVGEARVERPNGTTDVIRKDHAYPFGSRVLVPTQIISIPLYVTFRYFLFGAVNLIDNPLVMYLPAMTANGIRAGLMIFIFRQFFRGLPKELEDAAYLDGCGPFRTFLKVMIPNAGSSFLTVFLFSIVWYWNDYYVAGSFFSNRRTISMVLKNLDATLNVAIFNNANANVSVREKIIWLEAGCLISITPLLILYACLQKHFTEGIERSGIVG